jgi:hypothetical protein
VQEQESYWKNIVKYKDIEISELKNLAEQSWTRIEWEEEKKSFLFFWGHNFFYIF